MVFIPNQHVNIVVSGEAFERLVFVIADTIPQCAGDTNIDGAAIAVSGNLNGGKFFFAHGRKIFHAERVSRSWAPAFAGVTEFEEWRRSKKKRCFKPRVQPYPHPTFRLQE